MIRGGMEKKPPGSCREGLHFAMKVSARKLLTHGVYLPFTPFFDTLEIVNHRLLGAALAADQDGSLGFGCCVGFSVAHDAPYLERLVFHTAHEFLEGFLFPQPFRICSVGIFKIARVEVYEIP
jgi:hypothetical protein